MAAVFPDAAACQGRLRSEVLAAERIRGELSAMADAVGAAAVAKAVAADATATLELVGIPLTPAEDEALRASGWALDAATPLAYWVQLGAPERFGGLWIDPPGTDRYVIAVLGGDPATLALARCLERPGLDVRYVVAVRSMAELEALQEQVNRDWQSGALGAIGIEVTFTGQTVREGQFVVEIGVSGLTEDERRVLQQRYGDGVRVEEGARPVPADG